MQNTIHAINALANLFAGGSDAEFHILSVNYFYYY